MTPNRKHVTLSLAAAMLIFSTGTVFAQDDRQQARGQRGGIAGAVPGGNQGRAVEPALPIEAPILPDTLPAPDRTQSPTLPPELPLPDVSDVPSMPDLEEPSQQAGTLPSLPALGEPSQSDQQVTITDDQSVTISQEPSAEKKPGFFKRMWTKVKGFVSGVKNKVSTMIANNRAKRAERKAAKALEASSQSSQSAQVFDADIYQGGGGGAGGGAE